MDDKIVCPNCGMQYSYNYKQCPNCGSKTDNMFFNNFNNTQPVQEKPPLKNIIGYDDSPKNVYVMEEKPSKEDMSKTYGALLLLAVGFLFGKIGIVFVIAALVISFTVKKTSLLNLLVRISAVVEIIVIIVSIIN